MALRCKGVNSKCFLFTYLVIVGLLLVLWFNKVPSLETDSREIPTDLHNYIESPARSLAEISLLLEDKLVLTNEWFIDKWTFVYFTHSSCLPDCKSTLNKISQLQHAFSNRDIQFLLINLDPQHQTAAQLQRFLAAQDLAVTAASARNKEALNRLAKNFIALFLQTDFSDGSYIIEQQHHIFLIDPKGRVFATFKPPYTSKTINQYFSKLRLFYGRTE